MSAMQQVRNAQQLVALIEPGIQADCLHFGGTE